MKPIVLLITASLTATPVIAQPAKQMPGMATKAAKSGNGSGIVKALDPKTAKVTIQHGPIAALAWPGMTMAFIVSPPTLLRGVKVGQRIDFMVKVTATGPTVTAIKPR
ncbi:copper-binding protein [Sphingomonas sp. A2-49]|jgi:Cu(I)/Ag(I) efflux system protein CusF|uniref:copper-binding protein n=1 Tax=Sphingomonas sp. A2-49 TaxID=1391375 RepID=UPI0021CF7B58|nr:copper-binding protein [Sphingomonas sp. A2-49]MCU6453297.1 copper-binding protein [Sphingomonas sp. A2-49]